MSRDHQIAGEWSCPPGLINLNPGSFGWVPKRIWARVREWQERVAENSWGHFVFDHGGGWYQRGVGAWERGRAAMAEFVGAELGRLVLVEGATAGVNTVLRSLLDQRYLRAGDEILVTSWGYNACSNAARYVAGCCGAQVVEVALPFPFTGTPDDIRQRIMDQVSPRTRLVMVDHITSRESALLPVADIAADLRVRGIPLLLDGAHAPGQIPLRLDELGAAFYVGNGHKWLGCPPTVGLLYVDPAWQEWIRPLCISHAYNDIGTAMSVFEKSFSWPGTRDATPAYVIPDVLAFWDALPPPVPGGPQGLRAWVERNRAVTDYAEQQLGQRFGLEPTLPPAMRCANMRTVQLPPGPAEPLRDALLAAGIVPQVIGYGAAADESPARFLRVGVLPPVGFSEIDRLVDVLTEILPTLR